MGDLALVEHNVVTHGALPYIAFEEWSGQRREYGELATAADHLVLLYEGDEVVAIAGLSEGDSRGPYIESLASKRRGYGRPLIDGLKSLYDRFYLYSAFPQADRFYDACGLERLWAGSSYFQYMKGEDDG